MSATGPLDPARPRPGGLSAAYARLVDRLRWFVVAGWLLLAAALVPLATPGVVHAIALRIAIRAVGLDPGPLAVLLGHAVHATPLAALMVGASTALMSLALGGVVATRSLFAIRSVTSRK